MPGGTTRKSLNACWPQLRSEYRSRLRVYSNGDVGLVGVLGAESVDLHGVVDDQVHRNERVDCGGVAPGPGDGAAQCGQVDHGRDSGEVLHQHPGRHVGQAGALGLLGPGGERHHVGLGDVPGAGPPQQVLQKDLHCVGQGGQVYAGLRRQPWQAEDSDVAVRSWQLFRVSSGSLGMGSCPDRGRRHPLPMAQG